MSTTATVPKDWKSMRSAPIDRSKRIAPGAEIDPKHILGSKSRPRKEINYKDLHLGKLVEGDKENLQKNMANMSLSLSTSNDRQRKPLEDVASETATSPSDASLKIEKAIEEETIEETQTRKKVNRRAAASSPVVSTPPQPTQPKYALSDAVITEVIRLGGEIPQTVKSRKYNGQIMPANWLLWGKIKFPETKSLNNESLDAEFSPMEILFEPQDVLSLPFVKDNPDFYILGEGPIILVSKLSETSPDPKVWVADDTNHSVEGPYQLSSFLKGCVLLDKPADE